MSSEPTQEIEEGVATPIEDLKSAVRGGISHLIGHFDEIDPLTQLIASNVGRACGAPELAARRSVAIGSIQEQLISGDDFMSIALRMYRRAICPEQKISSEEVEALTASTEVSYAARVQWVFATACLCGTPQFPPDWSSRFRAMVAAEDPDGYVATHAAFGLIFLRERGCGPHDMAQLCEEVTNTLLGRMPVPFAATDAAIEAVAALSAIGSGELVPPASVKSILDAQAVDGGWPRSPQDTPDGSISEWHTGSPRLSGE